jgi:hypothetical protein
MLTIDIVEGTQRSWDLQVNLANGSPTTDLLSTDAFTAKLWQGGTRPTLATPTVVYLGTGSVTMTITAAQSALNYGEPYFVEIYRTRSGVTDCIGLVSLNILSAPGS